MRPPEINVKKIILSRRSNFILHSVIRPYSKINSVVLLISSFYKLIAALFEFSQDGSHILFGKNNLDRVVNNLFLGFGLITCGLIS